MKNKSTYQRVYDCVRRYKDRTGHWPTVFDLYKCIKVKPTDVIRVAMASPHSLDYTVSGNGIVDWEIRIVRADPDGVNL